MSNHPTANAARAQSPQLRHSTHAVGSKVERGADSGQAPDAVTPEVCPADAIQASQHSPATPPDEASITPDRAEDVVERPVTVWLAMADGCARAAHRDRDRAIEQATRSYESDAAREGWTEEPVYTALRVTALPSLAEQAAALLDVADEVRLQLIAELRATGAAQHERGLAEAFYRLVEAELLEPAIRYSGSTEGLYQARQREDRGLPHRESPDPTDYLRGWRPTLEYLADRDRDRGALEDAMGKVLKAWNAVTGSDVVSLWLAVDDDGGVFGMSTTSPDEALYDARYSILWNIRDIEKSSGEPYSAEDLESEANRPLDVVRVTAPSPWAMLRLLVVPACAPAVMKDQRPQLLTLLGINPENVEHLAEWGTDPVVRKTCRKLLDETPDIVGIGGAS